MVWISGEAPEHWYNKLLGQKRLPRALLAVRVAAVVVITNTAKGVTVWGGGGPHLGRKIFSSKGPRIKPAIVT